MCVKYHVIGYQTPSFHHVIDHDVFLNFLRSLETITSKLVKPPKRQKTALITQANKIGPTY